MGRVIKRMLTSASNKAIFKIETFIFIISSTDQKLTLCYLFFISLAGKIGVWLHCISIFFPISEVTNSSQSIASLG